MTATVVVWKAKGILVPFFRIPWKLSQLSSETDNEIQGFSEKTLTHSASKPKVVTIKDRNVM